MTRVPRITAKELVVFLEKMGFVLLDRAAVTRFFAIQMAFA